MKNMVISSGEVKQEQRVDDEIWWKRMEQDKSNMMKLDALWYTLVELHEPMK